ncbi:mitotic checkpoint serine/threonine-protein kinase BUB1-like [Trifolium pratense]|uniref:mitotic checkpoint serine/threonine-protein kinase BUB1-like n=1 Tax=Trifolium pratense TaxID=57577 RepID=UPI001E692299|nr:mitotic checkpoint serine/threonine-protein kinase BUB1-like [Trifolium pratense]
MATALYNSPAFVDDPLLPFLWSIKKALEDSTHNLTKLLSYCINKFKDNHRYQNDPRFLKIWFLYMDASADFDCVFKQLLDSDVCANDASLYVYSACFFEAKGRLRDAQTIYKLGISRNAESIKWLEKAYTLFLSRLSEICNAASSQKADYKESATLQNDGINPWDTSTLNDLLKKINPLIVKFDGYRSSTKPYTGKVALSTLKNASRNKVIEIGSCMNIISSIDHIYLLGVVV